MKSPAQPAGRNFFSPFLEVVQAFMDNNCLQAGAALAYYSMFSLAPILVIIMTITGYFLGDQTAQAEILHEITRIVGTDNANTIRSLIQATRLQGQNQLLTIITVTGLLLAATGVFGTLENTFNRIWRVNSNPANALRYYALTRLRSFGILLLIGFLLLATQLLNSVINLGLHYFGELLPSGTDALISLLNGGIFLLVSVLLFATIFKTFSRIDNRWTDVLVGGVFTSALFLIGKYLITLYISHSSVVSSYGAAGSVIALMLWAYYSSLILLLGACFTYVFARHNDPAMSS